MPRLAPLASPHSPRHACPRLALARLLASHRLACPRLASHRSAASHRIASLASTRSLLPSLLAPVHPRSSVPAGGGVGRGVGRSRVHSRTRARTRAHAHTAHAHFLFQQCTPGPAQDTLSPVARSNRRSSLRTSLVAPAKLKKRHCYCTVAYECADYLGVQTTRPALAAASASDRLDSKARPARRRAPACRAPLRAAPSASECALRAAPRPPGCGWLRLRRPRTFENWRHQTRSRLRPPTFFSGGMAPPTVVGEVPNQLGGLCACSALWRAGGRAQQGARWPPALNQRSPRTVQRHSVPSRPLLNLPLRLPC